MDELEFMARNGNQPQVSAAPAGMQPATAQAYQALGAVPQVDASPYDEDIPF